MGAADAYQQGLFGRQIGIAVLDSGIYPHRDFTDGHNRIRVFKDFTGGSSMPYDTNGHGTHIAGIMAGSGAASGGRFMGMAPQAHLIVLKVLDDKGNGTADNVCRAIDWVVKNRERYRIRIMNISVGSNVRDRIRESRMLVEAVEYAWDYGLIVVAAAGNNGPDAMSVTAPGTSRKVITVGAVPEGVPAAGAQSRTDILPGVISNGRIQGEWEKRPEDTCSFSGRGPTESCVCKPDLVAPGYRIISCGFGPGGPYAARSGTSMAAPVVSGGIALLLNKYPDMTNKDVKICLRKSAIPLALPKSWQGWGMFSVKESIKGRCN